MSPRSPLTDPSASAAPELTAVVVHWRDEARLRELVAAWPAAVAGRRAELLVVDNSSSVGALSGARVLDPGRNLGFAGGANHGAEATTAEVVLLLNPDVRPEPGAVDELLRGFALHPDAAGIVPALVDDDGGSQHRWQLRALPRPSTLLAQALLLPAGRGPRQAPPAGTAIEQPAAAVLALRREVWSELGGLDPGYHPAWFEDVDLARRLAERGRRLLYHPASRWRHGLGGSVPGLGYGPFLWIYYRGLCRYLRRHHGRGWALAARCAVAVGMVARLAVVPLRRPRRARSRGDAARGLVAAALGALSGWRGPAELARRFRAEAG